MRRSLSRPGCPDTVLTWGTHPHRVSWQLWCLCIRCYYFWSGRKQMIHLPKLYSHIRNLAGQTLDLVCAYRGCLHLRRKWVHKLLIHDVLKSGRRKCIMSNFSKWSGCFLALGSVWLDADGKYWIKRKLLNDPQLFSALFLPIVCKFSSWWSLLGHI